MQEIEVGEYVNGRKIERVNDYEEHKRADFNLDFDDCDAVYNEDIKSIVTKEQFKQMEYKVEQNIKYTATQLFPNKEIMRDALKHL